jgi:aminopeptidase N
MNADARPTTHPIVATINNVDQANQAFDGITYRKGNQVIRMFEQFVTEDGFRAGVRAYMQAHAYGNATTADLWAAIEQASGRPLRRVADDFTRQPGVPLITVAAGACRNNQRTLTLNQGEFVSTPVTRATPRWHIPVSAMTLGGGNAVSTVTDDSGAGTLTLASCDPFVINPSQIGYYRTMYPRAEFERLAANFGRLSASDQLGMLYDTRAFGRYGRASAADVLTLASRTPVDADPLVWNFIAGEIGNISGLYAEDPRADRFRTYARSLLNPVFARVGWSRAQGESDNTSLLRATLIGVMSGLHDDAFETEALRRYRAGNIDGSVRAAVLNAVGAAATPQVYDELLARARAADDTLEKQINYEALGFVRDDALAQRTLDLALSPEIHGAEGPRLIFFISGTHNQLAADYVLQHQQQIAERIDENSARNAYPQVLAGSNDPAMQQQLRAYIDSMPAGTKRAAEAAYAAMAERMSTRARRLDEISAWLGQRRAR